jgi:hypothetical protein
MIKKVVRKINLQSLQSAKDDLSYWLSRPTEERVAAVDYLRRQYYGSTARLQRVARVIQRGKKDLADLEFLGEE